MLTKILLIPFLFCFSLQIRGQDENVLKVLFDDLNYDLKVVWDQEDKEFYQRRMNKMSLEEASSFMTEFMRKTDTTGTSWGGDSFAIAGLAAISVTVAILLLSTANEETSSPHSCVDPVYVCAADGTGSCFWACGQ